LIRRDTKEEFLRSLENWMNEIVANNANGHNEAIPEMIKDGFQCSMKANIVYNKEMANMLGSRPDKTLIAYHLLMSDMYRTFMCN
jgi:hypothetical protein